MSVDGRDEQALVPVDVARWVALAEHALDAEGVRGGELSILFVGEDTIAELNAEHMGQTGPTDVLAFPIDDDPSLRAAPAAGDVPVLLGDVVVCPAVAARQAPEHDSTLDDELALLVVHGVLHVLGHDHAEPDERQAMQARERHILDSFAPAT